MNFVNTRPDWRTLNRQYKYWNQTKEHVKLFSLQNHMCMYTSTSD